VQYELEFEDTFEDDVLDADRWLPYYLPHWSSRERSAAQYEVRGGQLRLLIREDQPPWCPELDGTVRVSSIQTGVFAGPVGSAIGQHRFNPAARVREAQSNVRLYTPMYGRFEVHARASDDPRVMVAFWLIGYEDEPERSAEICVCEIFGRDVGPTTAIVGLGLHPFGDPGISDDFARVSVPINARAFHTYAVEWVPGRVVFLIDGSPVKSADQAPDYPMQLMLSIYEFPDGDERGAYPKEFVIDHVRGYRLGPPRSATRSSDSIDGTK
jgi:hypothetical protein